MSCNPGVYAGDTEERNGMSLLQEALVFAAHEWAGPNIYAFFLAGVKAWAYGKLFFVISVKISP